MEKCRQSGQEKPQIVNTNLSGQLLVTIGVQPSESGKTNVTDNRTEKLGSLEPLKKKSTQAKNTSKPTVKKKHRNKPKQPQY